MSRSIRAISIPYRNKVKSANMLQARRLAINVDIDDELKIGSLTSYIFKKLDVAALLTSSPMHLQLSNCFDQYKILNYVISISLKGIDGSIPLTNDNFDDVEAYGNLFTIVDRTSIKDTTNIDALRCYSSFREILLPLDGSSVTDYKRQILVNNSYCDTKNTASIPLLYYGVSINQSIVNRLTFRFNINFKFDVIYRGVRFDDSYVTTRINPIMKSVDPVIQTIVQKELVTNYIVNKITVSDGINDVEIDMGEFTYNENTQTGTSQFDYTWVINIRNTPETDGTRYIEFNYIPRGIEFSINRDSWFHVEEAQLDYRWIKIWVENKVLYRYRDRYDSGTSVNAYLRTYFNFTQNPQ